MMDQFVTWRMNGVVFLGYRNENDWYILTPIKRLE